MSFILDALKKSEGDRQRKAGPSLFEIKVSAPRRALPPWALIIGALLLINAAVLGWVLVRHPAPTAVGPPGMSPRAVARTGPADTPIETPSSAGIARAQGADGRSTVAPADASGAEASAPVSPAAGADTSAADFAPAIQPAAQSGASAPPGGTLPRYQDLVATPGSSLPALHLDLHVYDSNPSKRYVMINMQSLREGDSLPDGVTVVAIRPDGAVLSYQGRQFLLAR